MHRIAAFVATASIVLFASLTVAQQQQEGTSIAQSLFTFDEEGWMSSSETVQVQHTTRAIRMFCRGSDAVFFVAPRKFLGNMRAAYGGFLEFRLGFFEFNSDNKDVVPGVDIILKGSNRMSIVAKGVVPDWAFSTDAKIELSEAGNWAHEGTGAPVSAPEMKRILSNIQAIHIRGTFYAGHQDTYLSDVRISAGKAVQTQASLRKSSVRVSRVLSSPAASAQELDESTDDTASQYQTAIERVRGAEEDQEGGSANIATIEGDGVALGISQTHLHFSDGASLQSVSLEEVYSVNVGERGSVKVLPQQGEEPILVAGRMSQYSSRELTAFFERVRNAARNARAVSKTKVEDKNSGATQKEDL